jgi:hypothetical protein
MRWSPIVVLAAVAAVVWWRTPHAPEPISSNSTLTNPESGAQFAQQAPTFHCEGKTHCSEMRSCEEATFYLKNCPGVKIDGDNDGVPCESQFCQ